MDPTCSGPCNQIDEGGPTVEVAGVANVGRQRFTPQPRTKIRYQALQTFTYFAGRINSRGVSTTTSSTSRDGSLPLHFGGQVRVFRVARNSGLLPAPVSPSRRLPPDFPRLMFRATAILPRWPIIRMCRSLARTTGERRTQVSP